MSRVSIVRTAALSIVMSCAAASVPVAAAQDSFGGGLPQPQSPPQQAGQEGGRDGAMVPGGGSGEAQDFGVPPTPQLRPSERLHGPTPTSIPGGKVIATRQLSQLLQQRQGEVLLLHAFGGMEHLPGAIAVAPASQGGGFDDQVQRAFGQYLQQATGGDTRKTLVFYCAGVQCWGSYNASLRAIRMGFRNVHWYRGGLEAWRRAGLPVRTAGGPGQDGSR